MEGEKLFFRLGVCTRLEATSSLPYIGQLFYYSAYKTGNQRYNLFYGSLIWFLIELKFWNLYNQNMDKIEATKQHCKLCFDTLLAALKNTAKPTYMYVFSCVINNMYFSSILHVKTVN